MNFDEKKWYVFKVMSRHEKQAADHLKRKGIQHYLPLRPRKRTWSDRTKIIDFPVFPGYIFAKIDWGSEKNTVFGASGICGYITVDDKQPAVMTEEDLQIIETLVQGPAELTVASDENYPSGSEIVIDHGPFKGIQGVVSGVKNKKTLFVKIPFLSQMVSVEIDAMDVEKIV